MGLLLDEFRLAVPAAVREELLAEDPRRPRLRADYQDVFAEVEPLLSRLPDPEPEPVAGLDPGEAAVVGCARALDAVALINERRGKRVAAALGVVAIDVPQVVVLLAARRVIDVPAARASLARIHQLSSSPREYLDEAERYLSALERSQQ